MLKRLLGVEPASPLPMLRTAVREAEAEAERVISDRGGITLEAARALGRVDGLRQALEYVEGHSPAGVS